MAVPLLRVCFGLLLCVSSSVAALAQNSQPANAPQGLPPGAAQPAETQPPQSQPPQSEPSQPQMPQQQASQEQTSQTEPDADGGGFVFKKEVQEVVLHAIVVDEYNHLVTQLNRENFRVLEDGKPQAITSFRHENVPVALGIVVDNSGSMRRKREKLTEAALKLVEASQGQDQVFVVNFDEEPYLDQDFTGDIPQLKAALERTGTRGVTALYDAVVASAEHLNHAAPQQKKILLVITDGEDNASQETFPDALQKLQSKSGPVVYAIVLRRDGDSGTENGQPIRKLCETTGGTAFFPGSLDEVRSIAERIASDIRNQYLIEYKASSSDASRSYHAISVQASERPGDQLRVSTRTGYYSGSPMN